MFSNSTQPLHETAQMHLQNIYKNCQFLHVVQAFMQKYNKPNKFVTTTICHVEQLDAERFQFVRRMEITFMSQPIYEKIIVDRRQQNMQGWTYQSPSDAKHTEHYTYQLTDDGNTAYDNRLFENPGLKRVYRHKAHQWGVEGQIERIEAIKAEAKQKLGETKDKLIEKAEDTKERVCTKAETFKATFDEKKECLKEKLSPKK